MVYLTLHLQVVSSRNRQQGIELPNGKTEFGKTINNNPEKYFTDDVMERLEVVVRDYFKYGNENRTDDTQESDSE